MAKEKTDDRCWLPPGITDYEEFLCEELQELRKYVKETRGEDIAEQLYVFENRVLFSDNGWQFYEELCRLIRSGQYKETDLFGTANAPISWETIRTYPCGSEKGELYFFEIDKREVKKIFLMGWTEVRFWDRGLHREQKIFPPPKHPEDINISSDEKDFFIEEESARFSLNTMRNYADMYLFVKPDQRKSRPRFINQKESASKGNSWHVYVSTDLKKYYYGRDEEKIGYTSRIFAPIENPMEIIHCQKKTETRHAVIANFDSWQTFLHAVYHDATQVPEPERKTMNPDNTLSGRIEKLKREAGNDPGAISNEIADILKRISTETGTSGLKTGEKRIIEDAAHQSPRIRLLKRMAEAEYVRYRIGKYYGDKLESKHSPLNISGVSEQLIRLTRWISPSWEPQWAGVPVTAGDIPEQQHEFRMRDGDINISCFWRGAYGKNPAYIQISWRANLMIECELWLRFINPLTRDILSEVFLGTEPEGGKIITQEILGFDPYNNRWATTLIVKQ